MILRFSRTLMVYIVEVVISRRHFSIHLQWNLSHFQNSHHFQRADYEWDEDTLPAWNSFRCCHSKSNRAVRMRNFWSILWDRLVCPLFSLVCYKWINDSSFCPSVPISVPWNTCSLFIKADWLHHSKMLTGVEIWILQVSLRDLILRSHLCETCLVSSLTKSEMD